MWNLGKEPQTLGASALPLSYGTQSNKDVPHPCLLLPSLVTVFAVLGVEPLPSVFHPVLLKAGSCFQCDRTLCALEQFPGHCQEGRWYWSGVPLEAAVS